MFKALSRSVERRARAPAMAKPTSTPGTVYYILHDKQWTRGVYVGRYSLTDGDDRTEAYIIGIPADGTGPRDEEISLTGGAGDSMTEDHGRGFASLIAIGSLQGCRTRRPHRPVIEWVDQAVPRLDHLERMANDGKLPVASDAPAFVLTDVSAGEDEPDEDDLEKRVRRMAAGRSYAELMSPGKAPVIQRVEPKAPVIRRISEEEVAPRGNERSSTLFPKERSEAELVEILRHLEQRLGRPPAGIRRASGGVGVEVEQRGAERSGYAREEERRSRRSRRRDDSSDSSEEDDEPRTGRRAGKLMAFERMSRRFTKTPGTRWEFVEALAVGAGYSSVNRVELYVTECTKLGRSRYTALLGTLLSRIGAAAADGDCEMAKGLAGASLAFLEMVLLSGDIESSWKTTLLTEPIVTQKNPSMAKALGIPEPGKTTGPHRAKFSAMVPARILEASLESQRQWAQFDLLAKQGL